MTTDVVGETNWIKGKTDLQMKLKQFFHYCLITTVTKTWVDSKIYIQYLFIRTTSV